MWKILLLFLNNYMHKKNGSLYYKYLHSILRTLVKEPLQYIQRYRYATTKSISSPSKKVKKYRRKFPKLINQTNTKGIYVLTLIDEISKIL